MLMSERAINLTMLSNPYIAVTAGITALVSAMILFLTKQVTQKEKVQTPQATKEVSHRDQEIKARSSLLKLRIRILLKVNA